MARARSKCKSQRLGEYLGRMRARRSLIGAESQAGFTLVELLVVVIIIAIMCAIAIPTFYGQREKAQDTAAYTLVRSGLTVVQSAFVDTQDYTQITEAMLENIEIGLDWIPAAADVVTLGPPPDIDDSTAADAEHKEIVFYPEAQNRMDIASQSESGNWYGIQVDTLVIADTGYVKVKVIDGSGSEGW